MAWPAATAPPTVPQSLVPHNHILLASYERHRSWSSAAVDWVRCLGRIGMRARDHLRLHHVSQEQRLAACRRRCAVQRTGPSSSVISRKYMAR